MLSKTKKIAQNHNKRNSGVDYFSHLKKSFKNSMQLQRDKVQVPCPIRKKYHTYKIPLPKFL